VHIKSCLPLKDCAFYSCYRDPFGLFSCINAPTAQLGKGVKLGYPSSWMMFVNSQHQTPRLKHPLSLNKRRLILKNYVTFATVICFYYGLA